MYGLFISNRPFSKMALAERGLKTGGMSFQYGESVERNVPQNGSFVSAILEFD